MKEKKIIEALNKAILNDYTTKGHNFFITAKKYELRIGVHRNAIGRLFSKVDHIERWKKRKGRCYLYRSNF